MGIKTLLLRVKIDQFEPLVVEKFIRKFSFEP